MSLPSVGITKNVFTTSQAPPDVTGILAWVACSSTGTVNQPGAFARSDLAVTANGYGPLAEYFAYGLAVNNHPAVLCKGNATYPGVFGTVDSSGKSGSSAVTMSGAPYDQYYATFTVVTGGTIGTAGITFTWTLDGQTTSGVTALGTATTYTVPNSGITWNFGSGTLVAGDVVKVYCQRPLLNDTDVINSLTALSLTRLPWEGAFVDCSATTSTVGLIDTFLSALEAKGQFKFVLVNTPYKTDPQPSAETEAAYATRMQTLVQNQTSIRVCVGADGGHVPSLITGYNQKRPTAALLGARAMLIPIGEDAAYVARGPLPGVQIADANGNPFDHDEDLYPNLDTLRLTTLRSFAPGGPQGVYITNPNTIQPTGGAWPYLQHIRIMNKACTIAWFILTTQLSLGVRKNPKKDSTTGAVYIFEPDAAKIEQLVNDAVLPALKGQVSDFAFQLSRTDDMNANPVVVTATLSGVSLAYIKGYQTQAQWVKTITTSPGQ